MAWGCAAIREIALHDYGRQAVGTAGAIAVLIRVVKAQITSENVVTEAFVALKNIAASPSFRSKMAQHRVFLEGCREVHKRNAAVQRAVAPLLTLL